MKTVAAFIALLAFQVPSWDLLAAEDPWKNLADRELDRWVEYAEELRKPGTEEGYYRALQIYESLFRMDATPHGIRAAHELAMMYLSGRFGAARNRSAESILKDLADRFDHPSAAEALDKLRLQWKDPKEAEINAGRTALEAGRNEKATACLSRALRMPGTAKGPVGEEIGTREILWMMAKAHVQANAGIKAARSMPDFECTKCKKRGYSTCPVCKGKGRVNGWVVTRTGGREWRQGRCGDCRGLKEILCDSCTGAGINLAILDAGELKALKAFLPRALSFCEYKTLLEAGTAAAMHAIASGLRFPPSVKPDDVESIRLVPFPPANGPHPDFSAKWSEGSQIVRMNLLMDIAILTARIGGVAMFAQAMPPRARVAGEIDMDLAPPLPLCVAAAFPARFNGMWITVQGGICSSEPMDFPEGMREIALAGAERSAVIVAAWSEKSKAMHEYVSSACRTAPWIECYSKLYPYSETNRRLDELKTQTEFLITGRFLHNPGTWPSTILEVWTISPCGEASNAMEGGGSGEGGDGGGRDPLAYLRRQPVLRGFKSLKAAQAGQQIAKGLLHIANAGRHIPGLKPSGDSRNMWRAAMELEQARTAMAAFADANPEDSLADQLFTLVTSALLPVYRELGRK